MKFLRLLIIPLIALTIQACSSNGQQQQSSVLLNVGTYPFVTTHADTYYYTMQTEYVDSIILYAAPSLEKLQDAEKVTILTSKESGLQHIYSPEIHRINDAWYIYFEADDGNSDNHQIYVLENTAESPLQGEWTMHGPIITTNEWNFGLHPDVITVDNHLYMFWSGWQKRRTETEVQCIFLAEMENPWTLKSKRVMISSPINEWERQWINPNGHRSAYPIFVNENPQAFLSPDGKTIVVGYSASGIWTIFNSLGILYASTESNLLDANSWTKLQEPTFLAPETAGFYGTSNISVVNDIDSDKQYIVYQVKTGDGYNQCHIRYKQLHWDPNSLPLLSSSL